jgi:hypothetical protein
VSKQDVLLLLFLGCLVILAFLSSLQHDNFKKHRVAKAFGWSLLTLPLLVVWMALHVVFYLLGIIWLPIVLIGRAFGKDLTRPFDYFLGTPSPEQIKEREEQRKIDFVKSFRSKLEQAPKTLPRPSSAAVVTVARLLARNRVKDEMKRFGVKYMLFEASEIKRLAEELLRTDPSIFRQSRRKRQGDEIKRF